MTEEPHTSQPTSPNRYPTAREIVQAALATPATYTNNAPPTKSRPNYVVPCEDLDGNAGRLVVVPLGGRMALVGPGGDTAVVRGEDVVGLQWLDETLVIDVHGGNVQVGSVEITTDMDARLLDDATLSVEAYPYDKAASIQIEGMHWRVSWPASIDSLRKIRDVCEAAEQVLLGAVTEEKAEDQQVQVEEGRNVGRAASGGVEPEATTSDRGGSEARRIGPDAELGGG